MRGNTLQRSFSAPNLTTGNTRHHAPRKLSEKTCPGPVPINDANLAERLDREPTTPVICKLPEQLDDLKRLADRIRHLDLVLDDHNGERTDELIEAIRAGLHHCQYLTTLAVQANVPCHHATLFSWVCFAVVTQKLPIQSLTVSLYEHASAEDCQGISKLLSLRPDIEIHCRGVAASVMALQSIPADAARPRLVLSGIKSSDTRLMDHLSRPDATRLELDISLDDEDIDAFMHGLLQAGVYMPGLAVRTPLGRSSRLQDEISRCQEKHLDTLLAQNTQDNGLDTAALLIACKQLGAPGPTLFAKACRTAASRSQRAAAPEVQIADTAYLRALNAVGVAHVVLCTLPQDLETLSSCNKKTISTLRIELSGDRFAPGEERASQEALNEMTQLKSITVQGDASSCSLGWFVPISPDCQVEELILDLGDGSNQYGDSHLGKFLLLPTLQRVVCKGRYAASFLLLTALQAAPRTTPLSVKLIIPSEVAHTPWILSLTSAWMYLSIHIPEDFDLEPLKAALNENIKLPAWSFSIGRLRISSRTHQLAASDPMLLHIDKLELDRVAQRSREAEYHQKQEAAKRATEAKNNKPPTQSGYVDHRQLMGAFGVSVVEGMNPQRVSLSTAKAVLPDPLSAVSDIWLEPERRAIVSSLNRSTRSNTGYDQQAAIWLTPWVLQMLADGFPESECRPVLATFGDDFADLVLKTAREARH